MLLLYQLLDALKVVENFELSVALNILLAMLPAFFNGFLQIVALLAGPCHHILWINILWINIV